MAKSGQKPSYGYGPSAWRLAGRGIEVGLIIGVLTYVGHLGDERWETGPWLTLTGALLGMVGGVYNLAKDMLYPKKGGVSRGDGSGGSSGGKPGGDG